MMRWPQDTVTQLVAQVRQVGREVPGAQQVITEGCTRAEVLTGQGHKVTAKPRPHHRAAAIKLRRLLNFGLNLDDTGRSPDQPGHTPQHQPADPVKGPARTQSTPGLPVRQ